jgi:hypothetical protein
VETTQTPVAVRTSQSVEEKRFKHPIEPIPHIAQHGFLLSENKSGSPSWFGSYPLNYVVYILSKEQKLRAVVEIGKRRKGASSMF